MQGEILYSDTDSVYCVVPIENNNINNFTFKTTLGVKNEIKIKDASQFVCIGSKAYAYTNDNKV